MSGLPVRGGSQFANFSMRRRTLAFVLVIVLEVATIVAAQATRYGVLSTVALALLAVASISIGLRKPVVLVICYVALIPLDVAGIPGISGTLTRLVGLGVFATYALPRIGVLSLRRIGLAGWGFMAWAIASTVWALDPQTTIAALSTLIQLFLMTIIIVDIVSNEPATTRPILWAYALSASATAVVGVAGFLSGQVAVGAARAEAFRGQDPAQFAAILVPALIFLVWETVSMGRHWLIAAVCAAFCTAGILLSGTNSAWLAMVVSVVFVILPRLRASQLVVLLGAAVMGIAFIFASPTIAGYVTSRTESAAATGGAGRSDIWAVGATIINSSPIVGVGYANFPVAFTPDVVKATDLRGAIVADTLADGHQGSHSILFGTAAELGLVGLILLTAFLARPVLRVAPMTYGVVVQAMVVAVVTQALFIDLLERKHFWLVLGISIGLLATASVRRKAGEAAIGDTSTASSGLPVAAIGGVARAGQS